GMRHYTHRKARSDSEILLLPIGFSDAKSSRRVLRGFSFYLTDEAIRFPSGLWNSRTVANGQGQPDRRFQRNAMAGRNVHGRAIRSRAQCCAYRFVAVENWAPLALPRADRFML